MHTLGKVFIGLIILAVIGAFILTHQLNKRQDDWMRQIAQLKATRDKNNDELRLARLQTAELEAEVNRAMEFWGRQWTATNSGPLQGFDGVQVAVGANMGLAAKEQQLGQPLPTVYIFSDADQNPSRFLGEMKIEQLDNNRAAALLTREAYPGEIESWQPGVYRVRESIPPGWRSTLWDLHTRQTIADQQVIDETAKLDIQNRHIAASQKALDLRLAELNGDAAAPSNAPIEVQLGLVESIRQEEADRNDVLEDVDQLRRDLSDRYAELMSVLEENWSIVREMYETAESSDVPPRTARN
ncbi:MAG: hypothetical protein KF774_15540 [Planctomyces sp.]|nr:hypothetical protein [Planctomyces sp.]